MLAASSLPATFRDKESSIKYEHLASGERLLYTPLMDEKKAVRKVKFAPKAPQRRVPPKPVVKSEVKEEDESNEARELLRRFNDSTLLGRPKVVKKVEHPQSSFQRAPSNGNGSERYGVSASDVGSSHVKEYREPWDYYSDYPVSLPLRKPYSGDPVHLDAEEFGESAQLMPLDEGSSNLKSGFTLEGDNQGNSIFFLQLPQILPILNQPGNASQRPKVCNLNELQAGYMGKMLVYKSGAVRLKIGDTLFNVSSGSDCVFAQDVVAINTEEKHCCVLGELTKRVIVTADMDSILNSAS